MFLVAGGFIVFSKDSTTPVLTSVQTSVSVPVKQKPVTQQRTYIDLNGQLFELFTKAEITQAKKDGYKIVVKQFCGVK